MGLATRSTTELSSSMREHDLRTLSAMSDAVLKRRSSGRPCSRTTAAQRMSTATTDKLPSGLGERQSRTVRRLSHIWKFFPRMAGVSVELRRGVQWFALAAEGGYADSRRALITCTQMMTKPRLRDDKASVSEWVSHHDKATLATLKAKPGEQASCTATVRQ